MDADCTSRTESFAQANAALRREEIRSLTLERAAEILEDLLELDEGFLNAEGSPSALPNPLPSQSPAILIEGKLRDDF